MNELNQISNVNQKVNSIIEEIKKCITSILSFL